jgi:hypothetical protein
MIIIEMAKIVCCHCGHEMFLAHIYPQEYYMELVCSECNNLYLVPKVKEEVENGESNVELPAEPGSTVFECIENNQEEKQETIL